MKHELIPALLVKNEADALARVASIGKTPWIQIDALDNTLYPNVSWFDAQAIALWKHPPKIELHLMVMDPAAALDAWKKVKALKRVIWHVEAPIDHDRMIQLCKRSKLERVLALAPRTPIAALIPFLRKVDGVVVLGVEPGFSGQKLVRSTLRKIADLKKIAPKLPIGFDGGVNARNLRSLVKAGVNRFYVASALFDAKDPKLALKKLTLKIR